MPHISPLERLVDFQTLQVKVENLTERQQKFAHLIDPRFFPQRINPFRDPNNPQRSYQYETPVDLEEELFYLHPLMDVDILEQGAVRRFPSGVNEKYLTEKFFEDRWVSEGNHELSLRLESFLQTHKARLEKKESITILDIGPCGGAITTLFALRACARVGLLKKVKMCFLDIVPNVLEATLLGKFTVPEEMMYTYELSFAGNQATTYKNLLSQGILIGVKEWYKQQGHPPTTYTQSALALSDKNQHQQKLLQPIFYRGDGERTPKELETKVDVVLSAYTHHHMNLHGRKLLCEQMEQVATPGGFIGVADFYVPSYADYMQWYRPHFEKHGDAPPVECPLVSGKQLASWFSHTKINTITEQERTFILDGMKG